MNKILITSFDMEVGGVERSLLSMLNHFDYDNNKIDLMLYSHTGDFFNSIPKQVNLLNEMEAYKTFRMSIKQVTKTGNFSLALARVIAKGRASLLKGPETGYKQMQYMWKNSLPFLPRVVKEYDLAISYLWPHYVVAEKVKAKTKVAWIHTDYSTVDTHIEMDLAMWRKFDYIIAVSEACKNAFLIKYPSLEENLLVIENITAPEIVKDLATEEFSHPMLVDDRFKVITVARLSYAKGIDLAVEALKQLKERGYSNIAWYVVGYGGEEDKIKDLIDQYELADQFILLGKKQNPYPFMKAADLYVQPSRYEGKAVTVGEAQILSRPVLITNYPTAKSQVIDGVDGFICELSSEGIADGIEFLYENEDLRKELTTYCEQTNYDNEEELHKLYELV